LRRNLSKWQVGSGPIATRDGPGGGLGIPATGREAVGEPTVAFEIVFTVGQEEVKRDLYPLKS
jgi:hypothetical protein